MTMTYGAYLKVDELLSLQDLRSDPEEHDEMLFIIIHQTYELWFKQVLHELGKLRADLQTGATWAAAKTLRRILTIAKTLVAQIDILETMTPLEFLGFREFLESSTGFQSWQFREVEIVCGYRSPTAIARVQQDVPEHYASLQARMSEPTLWHCYVDYLRRRGHGVAEPVAVRDRGLIYDPDPETQRVLVEVMRSDPEASLVTELLVDLDEGLQEWRYRHAKMVERTIGTQSGTGGSAGAEYLHTTTNRSIFPDLWAIRAQF